MTSPTNPLLGSFVQAATTAGLDQIGANICEWVTGATGGIVNLSAWSSQLRTDATNAVTGITGGVNDSTQVAPTVTGIQQNVAANASNIAALQAQTSTTTTGGGASVTTTFNTLATGTLGPEFSLMGQAGVRFDILSSGAQIIHTSGTPPQVLFAIADTPMLTDGHQAAVVVGTTPVGAYQETGLMVRSTSNASSFVWALATQSAVSLGYGTWAGGTAAPVLHPWTGGTVSLVQGSTLVLLAAGQTYTLSANGSTLASHTDVTPNSPVGSANRYTGFIGTTATDYFGDLVTGWPVASFAASDQQPVPVVGNGWNIYCTNTSGVAVPGSSWGGVGALTYDTEGQISNDITVTSLQYGVIQVSIEGWYSITSVGYLSLSPGSSSFATGLYIRPAATGVNAIAKYGPDTGGAVHTVGFTWGSVYLKAGDQVSPAFRQNGSNSLVGDAVGVQTYFSGTLVSKA